MAAAGDSREPRAPRLPAAVSAAAAVVPGALRALPPVDPPAAEDVLPAADAGPRHSDRRDLHDRRRARDAACVAKCDANAAAVPVRAESRSSWSESSPAQDLHRLRLLPLPHRL